MGGGRGRAEPEKENILEKIPKMKLSVIQPDWGGGAPHCPTPGGDLSV